MCNRREAESSHAQKGQTGGAELCHEGSAGNLPSPIPRVHTIPLSCSLETVRWPAAQRLVDAVQANMAEAPESDACTDPVVLSFFETHPNFNSCGYTQLIKAERLLDKALTREVIKKDKLGRKEPKKETTWWMRQVVTLNEAALSWCAPPHRHGVARPCRRDRRPPRRQVRRGRVRRAVRQASRVRAARRHRKRQMAGPRRAPREARADTVLRRGGRRRAARLCGAEQSLVRAAPARPVRSRGG